MAVRTLTHSRSIDLTAAALLAVPAVLTLVMIMHHPALQGPHDIASQAAGIQSVAAMDRLVHGGLIAILGIQTLGFYLFSAMLGWNRPAVAAGFIAYGAGVLTMIIPSTLDGFVTPDLASACLAALRGCGPIDEGNFRLVAAMIQDFTKLALVLISVGISSWSIALMTEKVALPRIAGFVGILCAIVPFAILLKSDIHLHPGNLAGMIAPQILWSLTVAIFLLSNGRRDQADR